MKQIKTILGIMIVILISLPLLAQKKKVSKNSSRNWSKHQGKMNWKEAKAKCKSLRMRLPTWTELEVAYEEDVTKDWEKEVHWTSEQYSKDKDNAYAFAVGPRAKTSDNHVRCIR